MFSAHMPINRSIRSNAPDDGRMLYLKEQYTICSTERQETQRHIPPLCTSFDEADSSTYATPTKRKKYRIWVYATTSG